MNRTRTIRMVKYTTYALLLILLYVLQTVPGLFVLFRAKPIWVIPAAVAIAMMEGEFVGGIYGALAGLLCDMGSITLFGFNGFFVSLCCIMAGLLIIYLMHCNVWGCILFVAITMLISRSIEYFFAFGMWNYENAWKMYAFDVLPVIVYTLLVTPLCYLMVRALYRKFTLLLRD